MAIEAALLRQMRNDSLTTLQVTSAMSEPRDISAINSYLEITRNLRDLDMSSNANGVSSLAPGLESNGTIIRLSVNYNLQESNMPDFIRILRANTGLTMLNLTNCSQLKRENAIPLREFLKENQTITHLDMSTGAGVPLKEFIRDVIVALEDSPNILHFTPNTAGGKLHFTCIANEAAAARLLELISGNCENLYLDDLEEINLRLPSIIYKAEFDEKLDVITIAKMLINLEDVMDLHGIAFSIPARYAEAANELPRPFHPSANKVDFSTPGVFSTVSAYQAVAAGQVDDLLRLMKNGQWKISAEACLFKPEGERESLIELIARQGRLAEVMTVENWVGNVRGFRYAAESVSVREWRRQMKNSPIDKMLSQLNAASFKRRRAAPSF